MKSGGSEAMILVIGYGNELRRDDGVGPRVARAVAGWDLPGLATVSVHQLTPELAEVVAGADEVLFVDATAGGGVRVHQLRPGARQSALGHTSSPAELLAVAEMLYGRRPRAWLITVGAADLEFGEGLSTQAARGMGEALRRIRQHVAVATRFRAALSSRSGAGFLPTSALSSSPSPSPGE
jgi:hydrogenase maturation protease